MMGLLGLEGPSRWGGETALEVLGLGCSLYSSSVDAEGMAWCSWAG